MLTPTQKLVTFPKKFNLSLFRKPKILEIGEIFTTKKRN